MTGLELIVTALAAGAGASVTDTASVAVKDAYSAFKDLLGRRLAGRKPPDVLEAEETEPGVWLRHLAEDLTATGAVTDQDILTAATHLLSLLDPTGQQASTYTVTVDTNYGAAGTFNAPITITNNPTRPPAKP